MTQHWLGWGHNPFTIHYGCLAFPRPLKLLSVVCMLLKLRSIADSIPSALTRGPILR
jgi:hypothetical protein